MANAPLRRCPTCLTKVSEVDLGLRDYRWLGDALPGKVAPMDFDGVLERNGHFLLMEYKPKDVALSTGARIVFSHLVRQGWDVWVIRGDGPWVELMPLDEKGHATERRVVSLDYLAELVGAWFADKA